MNFLPSFSMLPFLLAGAACATAPIIIHLLNRRRFRTVHWAAMDFLRQAMQRNRRIIQLRDLLLLLLRTLAVFLFGAALAQPYWSSGDQRLDGLERLHAILVIDNSLSMSYQHLEGTLLEQAKSRARRFIERLPQGSRISVVPLCGSQFGYSVDPFDAKEHALEALQRIEAVDRAASFRRAVNQAQRAALAAPHLAKRIVFFSDQQRDVWQDLAGIAADENLPAMQIVDVSTEDWENTWIADLRVQDGLADVETPTTIIARLEHRGGQPRQDVQVTLTVDGVDVASKAVTVEPSLGGREVTFEHVFASRNPQPGQPAYVPIRLSLSPDRLPADDQRHLVVPVVASLPVVFVDQFGEDEEDIAKNRIGETRHLRKLLAPRVGSGAAATLVRVRHRRPEQLDRDTLADARLVVIAGVDQPGGAATLLRQYVEQGGQLVIAAGGQFDPAAWSRAAWQEGEGILPAPLSGDPIGTLPEDAAGQLDPFVLAFDSMADHPYFLLAGVSPDELRDLYAEPFFFKAVAADVGAAVTDKITAAELQRLEQQFPLASGGSDGENGQPPAAEPAAGAAPSTTARWLLWESPPQALADPRSDDERPAADAGQHRRRLQQLAEARAPRVLARFNDAGQTPFLIERRIGQGRVLFVSSGLFSPWNTLPKTNAIVMFDRILRSMIETTLPDLNYPSQESIALPLGTGDRRASVSLVRPGQLPEALDVGFIRRDQLGVTVPQPLRRGVYQVVARGEEASADPAEDGGKPLWETTFTVNGPAGESDLQPLGRDEFAQLAGSEKLFWVGSGQEISLAGSQTRYQDIWWWLILTVLVLLLCEAAVLLLPALAGRRAAEEARTTIVSPT